MPINKKYMYKKVVIVLYSYWIVTLLHLIKVHPKIFSLNIILCLGKYLNVYGIILMVNEI